MRLLAALTFFTRLPFWRIREIPAEHFKRVVPLWPVAGWLTGLVMALVLWLCSQVMPLTLAWILALVARLLLTGALHEDGLADFIDGFGGGTSRERTLAIMKDSHTGTFGVLGMFLYGILLYNLGNSVPTPLLLLLIPCFDSWAKGCAAQLINLLPYARDDGSAKIGTSYTRMKAGEPLLCLAAGAAPFTALVLCGALPRNFLLLMPLPAATVLLLAALMKRRIGGYTGDCCGAAFLLAELSLYLGAVCLC